MRTVKPFHAALLLLALASCDKASRHYSSEDMNASVMADSTTANASTAADAAMPLNSPDRKIVRTATIRVRVENLQSVTTQLETMVMSLKGIVTESNLQNEVVRENEYAYRPDSLRRVQVYVPTARMELRVPVQYLDSVVHRIGQLAAFTNSRVLKQDDVTLQLLSNKLKITATDKLLSEPVVGKHNRRTVGAAAYTSEKQEETIDRSVENMLVQDQVSYATLQVELFQGQLADVQVVVNPSVVTRAGFMMEVGTALGRGAEALRAVVLFLIGCWPFLLIGVGVWIAFRRRGRVGKMMVKA